MNCTAPASARSPVVLRSSLKRDRYQHLFSAAQTMQEFNECGKLTCARLSCVSEIPCLCCWMLQLLVLLTMTVILDLLSFDVAGEVSYLHLFIP